MVHQAARAVEDQELLPVRADRAPLIRGMRVVMPVQAAQVVAAVQVPLAVTARQTRLPVPVGTALLQALQDRVSRGAEAVAVVNCGTTPIIIPPPPVGQAAGALALVSRTAVSRSPVPQIREAEAEAVVNKMWHPTSRSVTEHRGAPVLWL